MRKLAPLLLIGLLIMIGVIFFSQQSNAAAIGTIDVYEGSVNIVRGKAKKPEEAHVGSPVHRNDVIRVPEGSRIAVILRDGSVFRLDGGTEVHVSELLMDKNKLKEANVDVKEGKIWWNTQPLAPGGSVEVETPTLVATVRGTSFHVGYTNKISTVYVSTHTVSVSLKSNPSLIQTLTGGMIIRVRDADATGDIRLGARPQPQDQKSEWIHFNEDEDAKLARKRGQVVSSSSSMDSSLSDASSASTAKRSSAGASIPKATTSLATTTSKPSAQSNVASSKISSRASSIRSSVKSSAPATRELYRLDLTPSQSELVVGERKPLTVKAIYTNDSTEITTDVVWTVNPPSMGTVDGKGVFTALKSGTVSITAEKDTIRSNTSNFVIHENAPTAVVAPTLERINVTFTKFPPSNNTTTASPTTAQFKATAYYSDQSTTDVTQQVQWSVSGNAKGNINASGQYSTYGQGSDTVSAIYQNVTGSATITVP